MHKPGIVVSLKKCILITKPRFGVNFDMGIILRCLVECCLLIAWLVDVKFHDNWPLKCGNIWPNWVTFLISSDILSRKMCIPSKFIEIE